MEREGARLVVLKTPKKDIWQISIEMSFSRGRERVNEDNPQTVL